MTLPVWSVQGHTVTWAADRSESDKRFFDFTIMQQSSLFACPDTFLHRDYLTDWELAYLHLLKISTGISVLRAEGPVDLLCKWPGASHIKIGYGSSFINLTSGSKPCYFAAESFLHVNFMHIICLSLVWNTDVGSLSHIWEAMWYSPILWQGIVCLLGLCSSCGHEVGSHSGQWHPTVRVPWVEEALRDEAWNLFKHSVKRYHSALGIWSAWGYSEKTVLWNRYVCICGMLNVFSI